MNRPTFKSSNGRGGGGGGGRGEGEGVVGGKGKGVVGIPEKLVGGERGTVRGKSVFPENWRVESGINLLQPYRPHHLHVNQPNL